MHKRGQVTIFVILGIVIVVLVALLFLFRSNLNISGGGKTPTNIKEFTESCVDQVGREALIKVGIQGGYYNVPASTTSVHREEPAYGSITIPVWNFGAESEIPSLITINQEINSYFKDHFNDCINDYSSYSNEGWTVESGEINVNTDFQSGQTVLAANYPVTATKQEETVTFDALTPITIPWDFLNTYETGSEAAALFGRQRAIPANYVISQGYGFLTFNQNGTIIFRITSQKDDEEKKYVLAYAVY